MVSCRGRGSKVSGREADEGDEEEGGRRTMPWMYCQKTRICERRTTRGQHALLIDLERVKGEAGERGTHLLDPLRLDTLHRLLLLLDDCARLTSQPRASSAGREEERTVCCTLGRAARSLVNLLDEPPQVVVRERPQDAEVVPEVERVAHRAGVGHTQLGDEGVGRPRVCARRRSSSAASSRRGVRALRREGDGPCDEKSSMTAAWSGVASTVMERSRRSSVRLTEPSCGSQRSFLSRLTVENVRS